MRNRIKRRKLRYSYTYQTKARDIEDYNRTVVRLACTWQSVTIVSGSSEKGRVCHQFPAHTAAYMDESEIVVPMESIWGEEVLLILTYILQTRQCKFQPKDLTAVSWLKYYIYEGEVCNVKMQLRSFASETPTPCNLLVITFQWQSLRISRVNKTLITSVTLGTLIFTRVPGSISTVPCLSYRNTSRNDRTFSS